MTGRATNLIPLVVLLAALGSGCSINRFAVNRVGNAIAGSGTTFASDNDPELVEAAVPFSLKLIESLLAESPRHRGLLQAAASGFTQYSYAFVQQEADRTEETDVAAAAALRDRARRLYLRARAYGLRGLETRYRGLGAAIRADPAAVARVRRADDVALLYWTAAAWGAAISVSKDRPELVADVPVVGALIERALALDEGYDGGAVHLLAMSYELARPGLRREQALAQARRHYDRALQLGDGTRAGPYVAWAEEVCVQEQDRAQFEALLKKALAIDIDADPPNRLANLILQRRARWLLGRVEDLFLE